MSLANLHAIEDSISGTQTLDLNFSSREIVITNDHPTNSLSFRFNSSEDYATLKGTETITVKIRTKQLFLSGNGDYRVWVFG